MGLKSDTKGKYTWGVISPHRALQLLTEHGTLYFLALLSCCEVPPAYL